jgi:hypothetical protein
MKFAAYTNDSIWSVEPTIEAAREEGLATMQDLDISAEEQAAIRIAPVSDELAEALAAAEETGEAVTFDLLDGTLVVDHAEDDDEDGDADGDDADTGDAEAA